jgi:hypothetical protein
MGFVGHKRRNGILVLAVVALTVLNVGIAVAQPWDWHWHTGSDIRPGTAAIRRRRTPRSTTGIRIATSFPGKSHTEIASSAATGATGWWGWHRSRILFDWWHK